MHTEDEILPSFAHLLSFFLGLRRTLDRGCPNAILMG
jgi:hypothetical protein